MQYGTVELWNEACDVSGLEWNDLPKQYRGNVKFLDAIETFAKLRIKSIEAMKNDKASTGF